MTYSDISDFAFRKKRIEKTYNVLLNLVSGIDEVYWDSNHDSSIREKVSSELINTIELYRGRRLEFMSEKSLLEELMPDPLSEEDRELYSTFMDTVISLAVYDEQGQIHWSSKAGTWRAVIERIEHPLSYKNAAELHKDLIIWNELVEAGGSPPFSDVSIPEGIFYSLSCAYKVVTGENLSSLLTDEQRTMAMDLMTEDERRYVEVAKKNSEKLRETIEQDIEELYVNVTQVTDEELIQRFEGDEEAIKLFKRTREAWKNGRNPFYLPEPEPVTDSVTNDWKACFDPEKMKKSCTLLLEKGVDLYNRKYFREDCINTLHIVLSQFGIGSWFDRDIFFAVYENMKKAIRYSRKAIEEAQDGN